MIDMNKKYRTRDGQNVRILCVDRTNSEYPVVALIGPKSTMNSYTIHGKYRISNNGVSSDDLIEVLKYDHIRTDEPVYVSKDGFYYARRHFARTTSDNECLCWNNGTTSFTTKVTPSPWPICLTVAEYEKQTSCTCGQL